MDATSAIRVECSRRGLDAGVAFGSVDPAVARAYQLPPLMVSHYDAAAALRQKVGALAGRRETQARDVFDVHLLLAGGATLAPASKADRDLLDRACANAMAIDFGMFKSQVLAYTRRPGAGRLVARMGHHRARGGVTPSRAADAAVVASAGGVEGRAIFTTRDGRRPPAPARPSVSRALPDGWPMRFARRGGLVRPVGVTRRALPEYPTAPLPASRSRGPTSACGCTARCDRRCRRTCTCRVATAEADVGRAARSARGG